ncbi:MAG: 4Fe-4S binding protein [Elusimicrobia bacterium]|nr:4Fe-4S binding protein [Elusimicrobiota bacterium]
MKSSKTSTIIRRSVQGIIFLFFVYVIWTTRYPLNAFVNAKSFFQIDPLVMFITAIAERLILPGMLLAFITLAVTFLFGRIFCGWFCPLGATFDIWAWLTKKFRKKGEKEPSKLKNLKYWILFILFLFASAGIQLIWFFDPITIFVRTFSFNIHPFINKSLENLFAFVIQITNYPQWLELFYFKIKEAFLAVSNPVFPNSFYIFIIFLALLSLIFIKRRFWCRYLCPLGALLAIAAKFTPFRRRYSCGINCGSCKNICRMNAIKSDNSYIAEECVLCLDCIDYCPNLKSAFSFKSISIKNENISGSENTLTRAQFIKWLGGSLFFISGCSRTLIAKLGIKSKVIRPPASLKEGEFVQRCVRCGNCMKVCPTNVLQPSLIENGFSGIWTPKFDTNIGYCEYKCILCGQVCPTGAIKKIDLNEKMKTIMGLAVIDKSICLPWAKEEECIVCEEHCPISNKAIKTDKIKNKKGKLIKRPYVDPSLCVGCAICENKCPVAPRKAIIVKPI